MTLSINISDNTSNNNNQTQPTSRKRQKSVSNPMKINTSDPKNDISKPRDHKPKKKRSKKLYVFLFLLVALIACGVFVSRRMINISENIGLDLRAGDIINPIKKDPELQKDHTGTRTNVLIVGIDTRATNQGLQNTDTIIVGSYDHLKKEAVMISIPRDTYAAIPGTENYIKINGIYNWVEHQEEGEGLEALKNVVEELTGLQIQYYGMVDVIGLSSAIDILGGVEVYVENSFTDYAYPDESNPNSEYQVVSFEAGPQTMDGETAVKYARSRKSLDNGEGSDFARARRQQRLIEAIKEKALSSETLLDPQKLLDILLELEENVTVSSFTNEDIQAGLKLMKSDNEVKVHSFVLDPYVGARQVVTEGAIPESYAITPVAGIGVYDDVHIFIQELFENPELYTEDPNIYVYDVGLGYNEAYQKTLELAEKYPFLRITFRGTLFYDKEGDAVYDNSLEKEMPFSTAHFANEIEGALTEQPEYITNRLNGEDITIFFGAPVTTPTPPGEAEVKTEGVM